MLSFANRSVIVQEILNSCYNESQYDVLAYDMLLMIECDTNMVLKCFLLWVVSINVNITRSSQLSPLTLHNDSLFDSSFFSLGDEVDTRPE